MSVPKSSHGLVFLTLCVESEMTLAPSSDGMTRGRLGTGLERSPVRAEQPEDLAGANREPDSVERLDSSVPFLEPVDRDRIHGL